MKRLTAAAVVALAVMGTMFILTGISNDDIAEAAGEIYSFGSLMAWFAAGAACIGLAWVICALADDSEN